MPRIPPKKYISCSQPSATEAQALHGENGDRCWNPKKCYFRHSYYKNRQSYVEKRWQQRHPGEPRQKSETLESTIEVPRLEYPVAILQMYRSNASSDVHAVGAELWLGGRSVISMFQWFKRILCASLIAFVVTFHFGLIEAQPALAANPIQVAEKLFSNQQLIRDAKRFLNMTPEAFCSAYFDKIDGVDTATLRAIEEGAAATATVTGAISSASAAGAGALSGYAGIASAVSQLGLGGLTSAAAGMMGSSASGAAATAVVTSAVGGPMVMGALIVGGTGVAAFGTYEAGKVAVEKLGNLAEGYCNSLQPK